MDAKGNTIINEDSFFERNSANILIAGGAITAVIGSGLKALMIMLHSSSTASMFGLAEPLGLNIVIPAVVGSFIISVVGWYLVGSGLRNKISEQASVKPLGYSVINLEDGVVTQ